MRARTDIRRGFLRTDGAADYLGEPFTSSTLKTYRAKRKGPPYYRGATREVLYKPEDLDAWVRTKRVDPSTPSVPQGEDAA
jgi:hypothetical protein